MATVRMAAGSVLNVVTDVASVISNTSNTLSGAIAMAQTYVQRQSIKQQDNTKIELATHRQRLIEDTAMENTKRLESQKNYLTANSERAGLYEKEYNKLLALFETTED